MLGTIPKTFSNDTLDLSSVDSMSLDEHIEIKIPEARVQENRLMAQNNFVQHITEKTRNSSHNHLAVDNSDLPKNFTQESLAKNQQMSDHRKEESSKDKDHHHHMHRSHSHASMRKAQAHGHTNGIGHNGVENKVDDKNRTMWK